MGSFSKGIRMVLRLAAGLFLLLNLAVSTIPRCDHVLMVLQHSLNQEFSETVSCHEQETNHDVTIGASHVCKCALVKFVFVNLPDFDPQSFIVFRIQSVSLIQFAYEHRSSDYKQGPKPPYPRWILV